MIEINNIKKGIYDYNIFISKEFYKEIKQKYPIPKVGDILITAVGANILRAGMNIRKVWKKKMMFRIILMKPTISTMQ